MMGGEVGYPTTHQLTKPSKANDVLTMAKCRMRRFFQYAPTHNLTETCSPIGRTLG